MKIVWVLILFVIIIINIYSIYTNQINISDPTRWFGDLYEADFILLSLILLFGFLITYFGVFYLQIVALRPQNTIKSQNNDSDSFIDAMLNRYMNYELFISLLVIASGILIMMYSIYLILL